MLWVVAVNAVRMALLVLAMLDAVSESEEKVKLLLDSTAEGICGVKPAPAKSYTFTFPYTHHSLLRMKSAVFQKARFSSSRKPSSRPMSCIA